MPYWLVFKYENGKRIYVSCSDEFGYLLHTENKDEAWKFYDFNHAMSFFNLGYTIEKH